MKLVSTHTHTMKMPELTNAQFTKTSHFSCGNIHQRKTAAMWPQSKNCAKPRRRRTISQFMCTSSSSSKQGSTTIISGNEQQQHLKSANLAHSNSNSHIFKIHLLNKLNKKISITYGNCAQSRGNTLYIGNGTSIITALSIMMSSMNENV